MSKILTDLADRWLAQRQRRGDVNASLRPVITHTTSYPCRERPGGRLHARQLASVPCEWVCIIDGFNLYYGGRVPLRLWHGRLAMARPARVGDTADGQPFRWNGATVERIVYCTARISGADNRVGSREQDAYLAALTRAAVVDHIEEGNYVNRVTSAPLATKDRRGRPVLTTPAWPVTIKDGAGQNAPDARFFVSVARREEKGSM